MKFKNAFISRLNHAILSNVVNYIRQEIHRIELLCNSYDIVHVRSDCDCITLLLNNEGERLVNSYFKKSLYKFKVESYRQLKSVTNLSRAKVISKNFDGLMSLKCPGLTVSMSTRFNDDKIDAVITKMRNNLLITKSLYVSKNQCAEFIL